MHLSDLRNTASINRPDFSSNVVEIRGDESLICDPRSNVKPTEFVEHKLQVALHCNRSQMTYMSESDPIGAV